MQRFPNPSFRWLSQEETAVGLGFCGEWSEYDRAQLLEMSTSQSEFNWYIVQGVGRTAAGTLRRLACMFTLHRTGSRVECVGLGASVVDRDKLGSALRRLVPDWLPLVSPFALELDDRPLFMAVVYDLDRPERPPLALETALDRSLFDAETFSICSADGALQLQQFDPSALGKQLPAGLRDFFAGSRFGVAIKANGADFDVELFLRPRKALLTFGNLGAAELRHDTVATHYAQRPRLEAMGCFELKAPNGSETVTDFRGDASQDRQWFTVRRPQLKWLWPHLRLQDGRELMGYVIRDSGAGRWASANTGREIGRAGWLIETDGSLRRLPKFDVRAVPESEHRTDRGSVPTRFAIDVPELDLHVILEHIVRAPFVRMQAFGGILDAGAWEGPARIIDANQPLSGHCWVEVVNAATARFA